MFATYRIKIKTLKVIHSFDHLSTWWIIQPENGDTRVTSPGLREITILHGWQNLNEELKVWYVSQEQTTSSRGTDLQRFSPEQVTFMVREARRKWARRPTRDGVPGHTARGRSPSPLVERWAETGECRAKIFICRALSKKSIQFLPSKL